MAVGTGGPGGAGVKDPSLSVGVAINDRRDRIWTAVGGGGGGGGAGMNGPKKTVGVAIKDKREPGIPLYTILERLFCRGRLCLLLRRAG